jgi:hypothetical protein
MVGDHVEEPRGQGPDVTPPLPEDDRGLAGRLELVDVRRKPRERVPRTQGTRSSAGATRPALVRLLDRDHLPGVIARTDGDAMTFYERYLRQAFGGVLTSPARFAVLAVLAVG